MTGIACILTLTALAAPSGQIAFVGGAGPEEASVSVLDLAGGQATAVGTGRNDGPPAWSADGQWLAWATRSEGGMAIAVARAGGSERRTPPHTLAWHESPRWSWSGRMLAYAAGDGNGAAARIMVYSLDKGEETEWGVWAGRPAYLRGFLRPVWLPSLKLMGALRPDLELAWEGVDFDTLLAEAFSGGALVAIGLIDTPAGASTEPYLLTRTQAVPIMPFVVQDSRRYIEWAIEPAENGERIAIESNDGGDREIFVIGRTGFNDVSNHFAADWNPVWALDSDRIAFESFRSGRRGVYRVFAETARVAPVAVGDDFDCWSPAWSPDGEWIAYVSDRSGAPDLWLCDARGGQTRQLTAGGGVAYAPVWRPAPGAAP